MAKPGIKVIEENKYKIDISGILKFEDNKLKFDVSEDGDGSEIIDIDDYLQRMNNENIKFSLMKKEVIEE